MVHFPANQTEATLMMMKPATYNFRMFAQNSAGASNVLTVTTGEAGEVFLNILFSIGSSLAGLSPSPCTLMMSRCGDSLDDCVPRDSRDDCVSRDSRDDCVPRDSRDDFVPKRFRDDCVPRDSRDDCVPRPSGDHCKFTQPGLKYPPMCIFPFSTH